MGHQQVWNVPYTRNPFFTGRSEILERIHQHLHASQEKRLPVALSGLGGIGKSHIALEYAHRYQQEYTTVVWVRAETSKLLTADYSNLARLLKLPGLGELDETQIIQEVRSWFQVHTSWLLILDNVENLSSVAPFLPTGEGHIVMTTQQNAGRRITSRILLGPLETEEGISFLLHRAGLLPQEGGLDQVTLELRTLARDLVEKIGGHPLALDQAGAYIEETGCPLSEYFELFALTQVDLLKRRGKVTSEHPLSAATTLSLSLKKVSRVNPATLDLLRLLSFFHPDAIPLEMLTKGATFLGPLQSVISDSKKKNEAFGELLNYSLIQRNEVLGTLSLHRLTQLIVCEEMNENTQRRWAKRVVEVVNSITQANEEREEERDWLYTIQAQECARLIKRWEIISPDALMLLSHTGSSLMEQHHFPEAEVLFKQALEMLYQDIPQPNFSTVIHSLSNLGHLYYREGKYSEAEPLWLCTCALCETAFGSDNLNLGTHYSNLAVLYHAQGKYTEAEPLCLHALEIREQHLGAEHPDTATSLNNLAELYRTQGKYTEAEPLLVRALAIREQHLGAEHPDTATSLNSLAALYHDQGKYTEAEPLLVRALEIREPQLGTEHPSTATSLNNLALLYELQGKDAEAEPLYLRTLEIRKQHLGAEHPSTAQSLNNLAGLYQTQGKYTEAEPLYMRALEIRKQHLGAEHPDTATSLNNLAMLYRAQGRYTETEPLLVQALEIREQQLGASHPDTAASLNNLATLYKTQGKYTEAEPLLVRALEICEQQLGASHPDTAASLNNLAQLYATQGKDAEAEPLFQRASTTRELVLGSEHPDTAASLWWLATISQRLHHYEEAEALYQRAFLICTRVLGREHPTTHSLRTQYAALLHMMGRDAEAKQLEAEP